MSVEIQPKDILAWNPPVLVSLPRKSTTKKTRPPAFFDKHLRNHLILEHVKRFPNLAKEIASVVDRANLPLTDKLRNGDALHMYVSLRDRKMVNEQDVADFYAAATATYLVPVASVLALSPEVDVSYRDTLLSFTKSSALTCAIADGFLRWRDFGGDNFDERLEKMVQSMDEQTRLLYRHRDEYPTLATWEVKSMPVGEERVMFAIPLLGSFNWTKCRAVDCLQDPKHLKYREMVDKLAQDDRQRIDASKTPWELKFASPAPQVPTRRSSRIEAAREALSMSASALGSSMKKRKHESDEGAEIKKKQKQKRKDENEDDEDDEDKDESFKDPQEMTAHDIIRQAWAQAVRENTTLVIIHSGNHELVCIRHRQSQTLYVSDVIEPAKCRDPAYGKLHVGIYMAALEDVKDRFLLWDGSPSQLSKDIQGLPGSGNEEQGRKDDRGEGSSKRGSGDNGGSGSGSGNLPKDNLGKPGDSGSSTWGQKRATDVHGNDAREITIQQAAHRNTLVMYLRYGIYDSPNPATFFRSAPSIFPVEQNPTPPSSPGKFNAIRLDDCLTVLLTSEIGHGATGVVLGGILEVEGSDIGIVLDIAVKLALTAEQREALSREYGFYKTLHEKGAKGIVTTLGLFEDFEGGASALVMLHGGESLATRAKPVTISEREAFIAALTSIHRAGIAHGDIRSPNFLINSSGEVTIIDFDQSIPTDSKKVKRREVQLLCKLLDGKEDD